MYINTHKVVELPSISMRIGLGSKVYEFMIKHTQTHTHLYRKIRKCRTSHHPKPTWQIAYYGVSYVEMLIMLHNLKWPNDDKHMYTMPLEGVIL